MENVHNKICKISAIYDRPDASLAHKNTFKDDVKQANQSIQADVSMISSADKAFKCHDSDKLKAKKKKISSVKKHPVVDDIDKPFKCRICQKSFQFHGKLIVHSRVHTGESKLYLLYFIVMISKRILLHFRAL